jgi:threonine/homoserine efflux transporter RhtA
MAGTVASRRHAQPSPPARHQSAAIGLVLGAIASAQFGSALAATLFDDVGPGGTVLLRLVFSAAILLAVWRPEVRGRPRSELGLAVIFGLVLAAMNTFFYLAIDRIPLGIAVTLEFIGPLSVAVATSRRRVDLVLVALVRAHRRRTLGYLHPADAACRARVRRRKRACACARRRSTGRPPV